MSAEPLDFEAVIKDDQFKSAITEMANSIRGLGNTTSQEASKMTDSFNGFSQQSASGMKASIKEQQQLIKDIEADIKNLQKTADNTAPGKNQVGVLGDLRGAKKALTEENATLIGMQRQQLEANEAEKESQNGLVSSLGRWAMGLVTVAAAMKIGKAIIDSTEATAHVFEQATTAAASATGVFFKAIATGDWSNFRQGMDRAVKGALDYVDAMEKLANMQNEQKIRSSKLDIAIGKARSDSYSTDPEVVKTAITELVRLNKLKLTEEADIIKKEYDINLKKAADDNNIAKDQLQKKIEYYTQYRGIIDKGEAYAQAVSNKAAAEQGRNDYGGEKRYQDNKKALEELQKELGSNADAYAKIATDFNKVPIPMRTELADQLAKSNTAFAAVDISNRKDNQRLVGIKKQEQDDAIAAAKKVQDEKNRQSLEQVNYDTKIGRQRIDNQIAIEQGLLDTQKGGAEKERQQADLDYRKSLIDIAKQKADQLKEYNDLNGGIDKKTGKKTSKYIAQLPGVDQAQLDQKTIVAEQKKAADIVAINQKENEELVKIQDEIYNYRLTGIEKEKEAVKDKYDKMSKLALGAMRFDLAANSEDLRAKANAEIDNKYALQEIDHQEQIEIQKAKLSITNEEDLQNELFNIWVRNQNKRIVILNKSLKPEDQKQAIILEGDVNVETNLKKLDKEKKTRQDILNVASQLTSVLSKNGQLTQSESDYVDVMMKAVSGDYIGAAITAFSALTAGLKTDASDFAARIEKINTLLKEQQRLIDLAVRTGGSEEAQKTNIDLLKQKQALDEKALETAKQKLAAAHAAFFGIGFGVGGAQKKVDDLTQALIDDQNAIDDAGTALNDFLSGGVTQNTIADIIAQGFSEGKTSVDDFAAYMNDVLLTAVTDIFKAEILGPQITELGLYIKEALSDDVLTQAEKDEITRRTNLIASVNAPLWNNLTGALNLGNNLGTAASLTLTGAIQNQLTEKTPGEIAGIMRKTSDDTRGMFDLYKVAEIHYRGIELNTFNTVVRLDTLNGMIALMQVDINKTAKNTVPVSIRSTGA